MPEWLLAWFENGTIIGIAVAILVAEIVYLLWRGARGVIFNALSGIALLLALGGALAEERNYLLIAACLSAGFIAHIADLVARLRR